MILLLKNLIFTFVVPGSFAVYLPLLVLGKAAPNLLALPVALPLFVVGAAIYAWCVWDFATFGRGTPAPIDPPVKLVVRGLYRWTRNPIYVGVLTFILGWAVLFQNWSVVWYWLVVAVFFNLLVLLHEEPALTELFGADYAAYRARVGRWFLPPRKPPTA